MDVKITDLSTLRPKDITILNDPDASTITLTDTPLKVTVATDQLAITTSAESSDLGDLQDVNITSVADGQLLAYDSATSKWVNSSSSTGVTSVNTQTGAVTLDTDDISEGTNNKYFTTTGATVNTDNLTEGSTNLYYADSLVDAHLVGGTGVTYSSGTISIGQPVGTTDDVTFAEVTGDEFIGNLRGATLIKAQAGEALTKGDAVYISGISGNTPIVSKADADDSAKMPAVGLANATVSSSASVDVLAFGQITNIDTTQNIGGTWAEGDSLYVNTTAGQLTKTQPTGEGSLVQKIAKIEKVHASTGVLLIQGAGRSNATPNLNDGNIFIGDSSNYATTASLDTKVSALGYITASSTDTLTNKSGNISQWTNDAGYLTSETDSQTLSFSSPNLTISNGNTVDISGITSGYLQNVVEDTTPQLGGNLDAQSNEITAVSKLEITNTSTDDSLLITTTEDTSTAAPVITLKRNSGSVASGDYLGQIKWKGENDADQEVIYAKMTGKISDETDTTEDGLLEFALRKAGSNNIGMRLTSTDLKLLNGTKLDMGSQPIENVTDPSSAQDAATKAYADTKLSDVVGDTSPQLGGNLDVNGQSIVSTSNGNITVDPDGTGKLYIEGDATSPGSFADRLSRLANPPLVIDNNQSNAWWGSQMIMKDNSDDVFAMVGRQDTSAKVYGYIITMDPNGNNTNTSAYAGDYGFYFNMQYEAGGGTDWYMIHNVFGADDGYYINSFGSGHNSYARTPLILNGSLSLTNTEMDLKGLEVKDSNGAITLKDNVLLNLSSGGTTAMATENESATGLGNRITVGTSSTAHTDGVGFEVRRGNGSGHQTQFKVETASSQTRTSVTSALNVEPVAYANLHSSPTEGDLQFLTTDGAGSNKHKPIYYDGADWRYFNDDSVVASS